MRVHTLSCCGGAELIGINDTKFSAPKYVRAYAKGVGLGAPYDGKGFCTITYAYDVGKKGNVARTKLQGEARIKAFTNYVNKHDLGEIVRLPKAAYNPNYGKSIKLISLVWQPNNPKILAMMKERNYLTRCPYGGYSYTR